MLSNRVLSIILNLVWIPLAFQYCYKMNLMSYRKSDTVNYGLTMDVFKNNTIFSLTTVKKDVPLPIWNILLVQQTPKDMKVHYNGSVKICKFLKYVKRVRVFRELTALFLKSENGNMSLTCPLPKGNYVLSNITVPPDTSILKFIYSPNSIYTLFGSVLSQQPNRQVEKLCSYEINATIVKRC